MSQQVNASVAEQVVRSQSGRIVANSLTSGSQGYAAQYTFDGASRMTQAILSVNGVVDHVLDYGFTCQTRNHSTPWAGTERPRRRSWRASVSRSVAVGERPERVSGVMSCGSSETLVMQSTSESGPGRW